VTGLVEKEGAKCEATPIIRATLTFSLDGSCAVALVHAMTNRHSTFISLTTPSPFLYAQTATAWAETVFLRLLLLHYKQLDGLNLYNMKLHGHAVTRWVLCKSLTF
jgi:hypothetical protein